MNLSALRLGRKGLIVKLSNFCKVLFSIIFISGCAAETSDVLSEFKPCATNWKPKSNMLNKTLSYSAIDGNEALYSSEIIKIDGKWGNQFVYIETSVPTEPTTYTKVQTVNYILDTKVWGFRTKKFPTYLPVKSIRKMEGDDFLEITKLKPDESVSISLKNIAYDTAKSGSESEILTSNIKYMDCKSIEFANSTYNVRIYDLKYPILILRSGKTINNPHHRRVYLDDETGILLKYEVFDQNAKTISGAELFSID